CRPASADAPGELACPGCARRDPLRDGIPVLLLSRVDLRQKRRASPVGRALGAAIAVPVVYDLVQRVAGARKIFRKVQPILQGATGTVVLDVGGGTGTVEAFLPPSAQYVLLDADPHKLEGFRAKSRAP